MSSMMTFVFFFLLALTIVSLLLVDKKCKNERKSATLSNMILLISSYVFILYSDIRCAILLFLFSTIIFVCVKYQKTGLGVTFSIALLLVFKYFNFFVSSFANALGIHIKSLALALPLGISFFVFSAISYLVDVSRKKLEPQSYINTLIYLSFFPKFVSGPIIKSTNFFSQITKKRKSIKNHLKLVVKYMFLVF